MFFREVLRSRWPYAISLDHQLLNDGEVQKDVEVKDADNKDREVKDVSKKDGEIKDGSDIEPGAKKPCEPVDDGSRKSSGSENTVNLIIYATNILSITIHKHYARFSSKGVPARLGG